MRASAEGERRRVPVGGLAGWLARLIGVLPAEWLPAVGGVTGWIVGTLLRIRRRHVEQAMKRAGIVRSRVKAVAASMYRSLGVSLIETLWLAAHPEVAASQMASIDEWSLAKLEEARALGRGIVVVTAHAGNWELAAAALAEEHALTAVVKPMSLRWVDRFCRESRGGRGIALARPEDAMERSRAALRRGGAVAMMIDQVPDRARHSFVVDFLCGRADVDRSPAVLAARMRAPLVVAVARRVRGGTQRLEVLAVLQPPLRGRRLWAAEATSLATRALDRWVHAHPSEWLWMHRRWRAAPP